MRSLERLRWVLLRLRSSQVAGTLAQRGELAARVDDLPGGSSAQSYEPVDESNVYATAALDLGLRF